jgi:ABC-type transporter Mla MlaB component
VGHGLWVAEIGQDPELEAAALAWASGDLAGGESRLRALLVPGHPRSADPEVWLTLCDLLQASGQEAAFDTLALEFAHRFGRSAPAWMPLSAEGAPAGGWRDPASAAWQAPGEIGAPQVQALDAATRGQASPWSIDVSAVTRLRPDAAGPLADLLARWAETAVDLCWRGEAALLAHLAAATPGGAREVDPALWRLRLQLLRVLGEADAFEAVALDYCLTYEVSPPGWVPPRCRCLTAGGRPVPGPRGEAGPLPVALRGRLREADMGPTLQALEQALEQAEAGLRARGEDPVDPLEIDCARLARIDFVAAGVLRNWMQDQVARGRRLRLRPVLRPVACLFGLIGLDALAPIERRGT